MTFYVVRNLGFEARDGEKYLKGYKTLEAALKRAASLERQTVRNTYHVVKDDQVWTPKGTERR